MFNNYALETKSHRSTSNGFYAYYDGATGSVIGEIHKLSFADEIRRSVPVQTVIQNQLGVINSAELQILKRDKNKTDQPTVYKPALDFLEILKNPNSSPSPKHWNDIVKGVYQSYLSNGIVALVLKGAKEGKINSIEIAPNVSYNETGNITTYNIITKQRNFRQSVIFQQEDLNGQTFFTNGNDIAIIFGNFHINSERPVYESPLTPYREVIEWNNHIQVSSNNFYKNSCRPSSIIAVRFLEGEGKIPIEPVNQMKIIQDIKTQLKGSQNTGKVVLLSQPNLDITVTPLSITQNANDIEKQLALTKEMIYSTFPGANTNVIEGKSEYSNNKESALIEFYDGVITTFTNIILDELNAFIPKWLAYIGSGKALERQGIYLYFNISNIERYKRAKITLAMQLLDKQIIKKEEARAKVREYIDEYADLEVLSPEEDGFTNAKPTNNA